MKIRTKIFIFTLSVTIPLITIISFLEIDSVVDKSTYYMERELLSKELSILKALQWLKSKLDEVFQVVMEDLSKGLVPDPSEFKGVIEIRINPSEKRVEGERSGVGVEFTKTVRFHDEKYTISVVISPSVMYEVVKDLGKYTIMSTTDGSVIFPERYRGKKIEHFRQFRTRYIFKRLDEVLDRYDIRLVDIDGEKLYLMPVKQNLFSNYRIYAVFKYETAVGIIKKNMVGILVLDSLVVLGMAMMIMLYIHGLTRPIESIINQLTRKRQERDYKRIEIETRSRDLDELVAMINDLLEEVSLHVEELEENYSRLEELHSRIMKAQDRTMNLNRVVSELMFVKDRKSVLDIAIHELRGIFEEVVDVCYEVKERNGVVRTIKGGKCEESGRRIDVDVGIGKADYRFGIILGQGFSIDMHHVIELFLRMVATVAENRNLWNQVEDSYFYLTRKLSEISEVYDDETGQHIKRVGEYSAIIAHELGMDEDYVEKIRMFSQLHDIGKLRVPRSILVKAQPLTP